MPSLATIFTAPQKVAHQLQEKLEKPLSHCTASMVAATSRTNSFLFLHSRSPGVKSRRIIRIWEKK